MVEIFVTLYVIEVRHVYVSRSDKLKTLRIAESKQLHLKQCKCKCTRNQNLCQCNDQPVRCGFKRELSSQPAGVGLDALIRQEGTAGKGLVLLHVELCNGSRGWVNVI